MRRQPSLLTWPVEQEGFGCSQDQAFLKEEDILGPGLVHLEALELAPRFWFTACFSVLSFLFGYLPLMVSPSAENPEERRNEWQASKTEMPSVPSALINAHV